MAKSKKKTAVEEVSRKEINGNIFVFYSDGSMTIIPAPIKLEKEEVEGLLNDSEEDDSDEDEDDSDDDEDDSDDDEDDSDDDEDDDSDSEEDDSDDDEDDDSDEEEDDSDEDEGEELTPEQLAEMDFEEMENLCDENDLETDPDDYDEDDVEEFRKALAKELGITLPKKSSKKGGKKK